MDLTLSSQLLGQPLLDWLWALAAAIAVIAGLIVLTRLVTRKLAKLAETSTTSVDDAVVNALEHTRIWVMIACGVWTGAQSLTLPSGVNRVLDRSIVVVLLFQAASWLSLIIRQTRKGYAERHLDSDAEAVTTLSVLSFFGRLAVWSLFVLLALDNLGFNVTALLAGLGVGGIAVALALQSVLGDVFASLAITVDKPFIVGDFLVLDGGLMGNVEQIGLKSTRLRSLSGEQIIMANNKLLNTNIRNYKRMTERRVELSFGVTYGTPAKKLRQIPNIVREIIDETENTRFDRANFKAFGAYSLDFEAIYFVLDRDYNLFMNIQEQVNLALYSRLEKLGVEFAFPTRTILLSNDEVEQESARATG